MHAVRSKEELMEAAVRYYEEELKDQLEPEHTDKFLAIDPDNRRWAVSESSVKAFAALRAQGSEAPMALLRVGRDVTYEMYCLP